ncbi:hypothetical protein [Deinococcus radiophilus]
MKVIDMVNGPIKQFQVREMTEEGVLSVLESINLTTPQNEVKAVPDAPNFQGLDG